jgi:hypothetical protein
MWTSILIKNEAISRIVAHEMTHPEPENYSVEAWIVTSTALQGQRQPSQPASQPPPPPDDDAMLPADPGCVAMKLQRSSPPLVAWAHQTSSSKADFVAASRLASMSSMGLFTLIW